MGYFSEGCLAHGRRNLAWNDKEMRFFTRNSVMANSNACFKLKMAPFGNMDMLPCYQSEGVSWSAIQVKDLVTRAFAYDVIMGMVEK